MGLDPIDCVLLGCVRINRDLLDCVVRYSCHSVLLHCVCTICCACVLLIFVLCSVTFYSLNLRFVRILFCYSFFLDCVVRVCCDCVLLYCVFVFSFVL